MAWTWPLGLHAGSRIAHDPGDPVLNTYLLWWNSVAIPFTARWWDPPFFYPLQGALALSEHLAGIAIISTPVQWLGGTAVLAYNLSLLASYVLSAFFAYLLVRRLTASGAAAICAGLAYGFAPFRAAQLAHLQVLTSQWLPLQLLAMHAYLEDGRRRWLVVCGVAWLLQGLSNGYYLLFAPVLLALWFVWFPRWRDEPRRPATLALVWTVASLPFIPILLKYRDVQRALGLSRELPEIVSLSGTWESFLSPPAMLAFWRPVRSYPHEDDLFPGITVPIVIAVAVAVSLARRRWRSALRLRSPFAFYVAAALLMAALALGPGVPAEGALRWLRPYFWLMHLPGFDSLRVPARFAMLAALCGAIALGLAVRSLLPQARTARALLIALIVAGIAVDGWMKPMPHVVPARRQYLARVPPEAVVLELPTHERNVNLAAMYRGMSHRRVLVNGHSGYTPPHYAILTAAFAGGDHTPLIEIGRGRPLAVIVNERFDASREVRGFMETLPGATLTDIGEATVYVLPPQPRLRVDPSGSALPAAATALPRDHLLLDLGRDRVVRTVEFSLGERHRYLPRFAVETSRDGNAWTLAWEEGIGGRAFVGALEDARRVPVRIPLPDVSARYLRLHPVPDWLIPEVRILGP